MPRKRDFVFSLRLLMKFQPGENTAKQNIFHFNIIVLLKKKMLTFCTLILLIYKLFYEIKKIKMYSCLVFFSMTLYN